MLISESIPIANPIDSFIDVVPNVDGAVGADDEAEGHGVGPAGEPILLSLVGAVSPFLQTEMPDSGFGVLDEPGAEDGDEGLVMIASGELGGGVEVDAVGGDVGGEEGNGRFRSLAACSLKIIPTVGPTVISTFDDVIELFLGGGVAEVVTAVVGGKEVAGERVEGEVVGVAQTRGVNFDYGRFGVNAQNGGTEWIFLFAGVTSRTDSEIEHPIGTQFEVVILVEANGQIADEVAGGVGEGVAICVTQDGDFCVAGDVNIPCDGMGGDAEGGVEAAGENGVAVGVAIPVVVGQNMDGAIDGGDE